MLKKAGDYSTVSATARRNHLMDKIIRQHLDKVDVLPLSPALLPRLLPKLGDVDANFDEVVEIISLDPSLTSKLLQICNSAYFGHESEVTSVAEAVTQVGYQAIYLLVAMINSSSCFPCPSPKGIDAAKLWRHSLITGFNAKFVGESAGEDGNLLFTAGLLHDLGKIVLGQEEAPEANGLFSEPSSAASIARETGIFGCHHAEVGGALLEDWKLPAEIVAAVRFHHAPAQAGEFERVAACAALGNWVTHGPDRPQLLESKEFVEMLERLGLSPAQLSRWSERLRDHQSMLAGMSRLPL